MDNIDQKYKVDIQAVKYINDGLSLFSLMNPVINHHTFSIPFTELEEKKLSK